ncbi:lipase [soil metagenome]
MLSALSPARRRLALGVGALAISAVVLAALLVVRQLQVDPAEPVAQNLPGPVLLVPGYGGSTASLAPLAAELDRAGRAVTVVELAGDGRGDLRTQAKLLAAAAENARDETGSASVDVVGYSAGGVIARLWVRDFGGAGLARRVVSLGSPHHGTDLADLGRGVTPDSCPVACQQLAPDSEFIARLNAGDETPAGPAFVAVWTVLDEVVTPPDSARLDGALNLTVQSVCVGSRARHGDLPGAPAVAAILDSTLGAGPPAAPRTCPA